jgi:demethylmenaquinone methyltransferase/2-methoxy-6-polyprenyl-1,4-benzoquinol methylase
LISSEGPDLSKSPERIAGMFDAIAQRYDFLNHFLSAGIDRRWRQRAIRSLGLTGRERVLDVCSGTADLAIAARRATPGAARVVGVDFAHAMLRVGREKLEAERLSPSVALVRGDALHLPVASQSVDVVTIAFGIRNVENVATALVEMHRVLKPGGRLAVLEFATPPQPVVRMGYAWYSRHVLPRVGRMLSRHDDAYRYLPASIEAFASPDAFVKLLRQSGFSSVEAVPLTFGVVYLYTGRRG